MGVTVGTSDYARIAVTAPFILGRLLLVQRASSSRSRLLRRITDAYVIRLVKRRLATYGKPEYTSDAADYTPAGNGA